MSAFAAYLQQKLDENGWSQTELEARSGVPDATISRILQGRRPSAKNIAKFAKLFGEEPAELMRLAGHIVGDPADPDAMEKELLVQVRTFPWLQELIPDILSLSPTNQAVVRKVVRSLHGQPDNESQ